MSNPADFVFVKRNGEVLYKLPGSINGNGFKLDTLHDCEVYILDHTSQVQVDDCVNCKIFIGPTDGSVFVRDCRDCTLCVAARQLRTRDCTRLDIALYCATQPSIETSTNIKFSCWRGAYPGLTQHFSDAKLDPTKNTWMQVYDFNAKEDLGAPHYSLDDSSPAPDGGWWLPPPHVLQQLAAPPECPVAAPDGSLYGGGRVEPPPPSPGGGGGGGRQLPDSLPPSPGRAAAHDEEIELEDDPEELAPVLLEGEDGGRSFIMPAQPSPRRDPGDDADGSEGANAFSFASPRAAATSVPAAATAAAAAGSLGGAAAPPPLSMLGSGDALQACAPQEGLASPSAAPLPLGGDDDDDANPFFAAAAPAPSSGGGADAAAPPPPAYAEEDFFFTPSAPAAGGNGVAGEGEAAAAAGATGREPEGEDARVAWRVANAGRLKAVAAAESAAKDKLAAEARQRLAALQQGRTALLKQRFSTNRANGGAAAGGGGKPSTAAGGGWAAVAELVDPTSGGAGGAGASGGKAGGGAGPAKDVTRFKQMLLKLKAQPKPQSESQGKKK